MKTLQMFNSEYGLMLFPWGSFGEMEWWYCRLLYNLIIWKSSMAPISIKMGSRPAGQPYNKKAS